MKNFICRLILCLTLMMPGISYSMGPLMITPTGLTWDREADSQSSYGTITGYYLYWVATQVPLPAWTNTQRSALIPQTAVGVTPLVPISNLNLPSGNWTMCVTSVTASAESGPSNTVSFLWVIPAPPANFSKQ